MANIGTVDDLADFLGGAIDEDRFAGAELALRLASAAARNEARQQLDAVEADTIQVIPTEVHELWLPERPVTAVASLQIAATPVVPVTGFEFFANGKVVWAGGLLLGTITVSGNTPAPVTITYNHGYATVPDDIMGVVLAAAARIFVNPAGLSREMKGAWEGWYGAQGVELTKAERRIMRRYRRSIGQVVV